MYDLAEDPEEIHNLAGDPGSESLLVSLKERLYVPQAQLGLSEALFRELTLRHKESLGMTRIGPGNRKIAEH